MTMTTSHQEVTVPTPEKPAAAPVPMQAAPLAVRASDDAYRLALEPNGFQEAQKVASMIAAIQLCGITRPEDAMARIMTGRALGIPTMASLRSVDIIEGRPGLRAQLKVALARRLPECEYIECIETSGEKATYEGKRRGRPERRLSFTIQEAMQAELLDRGKDANAKKMNNWNRYPAAMLRARASGQLVDMMFPEATLGLPSSEEVEDEIDTRTITVAAEVTTATPAPPQAAPARNFEHEMEALALRTTKAIDAQDREAVKSVRAEIDKFASEAGEPYATTIRAHYNHRIELAKQGKQAPTQAAQ